MQYTLPAFEPLHEVLDESKRKRRHFVEIYEIEPDEVEVHRVTVRGDIRGGVAWYLRDITIGTLLLLRFEPFPSWNAISSVPHKLARRVRTALMSKTLDTLTDKDGRKVILGHRFVRRDVLRVRVRAQVEKTLETGTRSLSSLYGLEYVYSIDTGSCRLVRHTPAHTTLRRLGLDSTWIRLRVERACTELLERAEYRARNPELL